MPDKITEPYVPGQYTGSQTETMESVSALDEDIAISLFRNAKKKLLDINNWHQLCGFLSSTFQLTDSSAQPIDKEPSPLDYIRIDVPGPGTKAGRGYDWVRIEKISYIPLDEHQELFFMQVRPAPYPLSGEKEIAHFFKDSATSSFMVVREMMQVTAYVYGRNEVANTDSSEAIDKIRNQVVGNSGAMGLSRMQWKSLVSQILKNDEV